MLRVVKWLAEPVAIVGIVLALTWAAGQAVTPVRVAGRSMSPALTPGDVVVVRLGATPVPGDIVLIRAPGHRQVLHRVVELMDDGAVRTKGDANAVPDSELATPSEISGRTVAVLPLGAWLARWRGQPAYATMASQPNSTSP
jgi:signal peptidase I